MLMMNLYLLFFLPMLTVVLTLVGLVATRSLRVVAVLTLLSAPTSWILVHEFLGQTPVGTPPPIWEWHVCHGLTVLTVLVTGVSLLAGHGLRRLLGTLFAWLRPTPEPEPAP